jgi:hypothetical protein
MSHRRCTSRWTGRVGIGRDGGSGQGRAGVGHNVDEGAVTCVCGWGQRCEKNLTMCVAGGKSDPRHRL